MFGSDVCLSGRQSDESVKGLTEQDMPNSQEKRGEKGRGEGEALPGEFYRDRSKGEQARRR